MKKALFFLPYLFFFSCNLHHSEVVFEGFKLGERLDYNKIESKFGKVNTLNYLYQSLDDDRKNAIIDVSNDTWNYWFSNNKRGFVTFYTTKDSTLIKILIQMGNLEPIVTPTESKREYWTIKEQGSAEDISYLTTSLIKKYGNPTDTTTSTNNPALKALIWEFPNYEIDFDYDDSTFKEIRILYSLNYKIIDKIENEIQKRDIKKQSDNF